MLVESGFNVEQLSHFNCLLFPAIAPALLVNRLVYGLDESDAERILPTVPAGVNKLLSWILSFEAHLVPHVTLPFGVSQIGLVRKPV